jgi:hypothetical protein
MLARDGILLEAQDKFNKVFDVYVIQELYEDGGCRRLENKIFALLAGLQAFKCEDVRSYLTEAEEQTILGQLNSINV